MKLPEMPVKQQVSLVTRKGWLCEAVRDFGVVYDSFAEATERSRDKGK